MDTSSPATAHRTAAERRGRGRHGPVPRVPGRQLGGSAATGPVLAFPSANGWGNVGGDWAQSVSTDAATFEAWIRTASKASQTIVIGSNPPGAGPRISVGGDQLSVYWSTAGAAPGWTSADTTPVTDGQWHHIAVVFDAGAITFYKDGVATADRLSVSGAQQAAGTFQLGAGFGSVTGFVGELYDVRVWSVARSAQQIAAWRWAPMSLSDPGLTARTTFNATTQEIINQVGGPAGSITAGEVIITDLPPASCALSFGGGPQDGASIPAGTELLDSSAATFECWMKMATAAGVAAAGQTLMCVNLLDVLVPQFAYAGDDTLSFTWNGTTYRSADTTPVSDGAWHHVAVVFNQNYVTFYKDGVATADVFQMPAQEPSEGLLQIGTAAGSMTAFNGELYDIRVWNTARTAAQVSSYRYVTLTGTEPGLKVLCSRNGVNPALPATVVNQVTGVQGSTHGNAAVVPAVLPQQPLPASVWTYQTPGESPAGPLLSPQGLLCTDNVTGAASGAFLRSVELETGQVRWSYDVRPESELASVVIPAAVGTDGQTGYVGVQSPYQDTGVNFVEIHAVSAATGEPAWPQPAHLAPATAFTTRPIVLGGTLYAGVHGVTGGGLAWGDPASGTMQVRYFADEEQQEGQPQFMTEPVTDATSVYIGRNAAADISGPAQTLVTALAADLQQWAITWQVKLAAAITADLALAASTLFIPTGGTIVALSTADGSTKWSHQLSGSAVQDRPVVIGSTLCVGSTDGTLYALDTATGDEQWRVDTGSPIVTDLVNEDSVLYFATAGDGAGTGPAFLAVDASSQGNDVLAYPVPNADTILFAQGGVTNGVVYFYGAQNVYAVNMSNVIREFAVTSKLIVENYDTSTSTPAGSDTSYRVTLSIRDENGVARSQQAVKLWSSGTLYVVNQASPVTLTPDAPVWMQTDASGSLTLAISAFDDGTPAGTPNVTCPPVFAWANFMSAGEAIVIYPDHESLGTLANVQGSSSSASTARAAAAGPAPQFLDQATAYDGSALILSSYQDPASLNAIADTVRNTVGTRNTGTVGASRLTAGRHQPAKYIRRGAVVPNVVYAANASAPATRPYVPGAVPTFTVDLSTGQPVFQPGTFDDSRPEALASPAGPELGGIFSDIGHFTDNVIKGGEKVAKMAWQFTENAVQTVIHTAESVYNLVITDIEDAVTAVVGFLKTVVADIIKIIQWLSALFNWENILHNHTYIKQAITNPGDPANPGILDRLAAWVASELNGGTDTTTILAQLAGRSCAAVGSTATATAGQTVQTQQAGNNDPNQVYNTGGNNNANQCTWMHEKVTENSSSASIGGGPAAGVGASWDPGAISAAFDQFLTALGNALTGSFADLPEQIQQKIASTQDNFKDPKSALSTGLSDILTVFQVLADDMAEFAQAVAVDFLQLLDTLLGQIAGWLDEPADIPFVSALYHALTGDQLSVLDLTCLLAAVPGTILLDVITGSPTVPGTVTSRTGAVTAGSAPEAVTPAGALAGRILLGLVNYVISNIGQVLDIICLGFTAMWAETTPSDDPQVNFINGLDFAVDFIGWALGMAVSYGWAAWEAQDWSFWGIQSIPQALNFVYLFRADGNNYKQVGRDTVTGVIMLVTAAVYAHFWPASYCDAPKARGIVLTSNVFNSLSSICEAPLLLLDVGWLAVVGPVKFIFYVAGNVLGFTANVLGLEN
jgi:outer membrane protein assembly factor BamB